METSYVVYVFEPPTEGGEPSPPEQRGVSVSVATDDPSQVVDLAREAAAEVWPSVYGDALPAAIDFEIITQDPPA